MASTTPHESIAERGFFHREDEELGGKVDAILKKLGYYFKNEEGLKFAKECTMDNEVSDLSATKPY